VGGDDAADGRDTAAREEAADTDGYTGTLPAVDMTSQDRERGPCTASLRSAAGAGAGHTTVRTVERFDGQVGDIRLYL
jgi:hypothetical protein